MFYLKRMIMKSEFMKKRLFDICLPVTLLAVTLASCSDDPEVTNEEEVITTVTVTLKQTPTDPAPFIVSWDDANLNSIVDAGEITSSGVLLADETYTATIGLMNETVDVSVEVKEEAEDHIFCFEVTGVDIAISGYDTDSNGQRLGLTSTWTTGDASTGTVNIKLRHQPGFKTGDCPLPGDPAPGETDVDITFDFEIEGAL
jgi:hypothetical protein